MRALVALAAAAACSSPKPPPPPPPLFEPIVAKTIADAHLLGLAVAIVDHGRVVLEHGYGFTDLDRKTPITLDTVFAIGSVSKQFTAAAVLRLVEDGKLRLADRAATYLPDLPGEITIQELLWQTTGLVDYASGFNLGKTPDELVHIIATTPLQFPVGTKWAYSNSNYYVLGRIVEIASKQPYDDYLRDQVVARAGLGATRVCDHLAEAHPSTARSGSLDEGMPLDVRFYGGAGAICSTARDLQRWQDALFGGKVLAPSSLASMTTVGTLADGTPTTYADGWLVDHLAKHRRIWHNGGIPGGYESRIAWFPDDQLQIVLLTNTENTPPGKVLDGLERALALEALHVATQPRVDLPLAATELQRRAGTFATTGIAAKITIDGAHLHVHVDGGVDGTLLHQGDDRFALDGHPGVEYRYVGDGIEVWRDDTKVATLARAPR